jgi:hypothetical protein
MFDLRFTNIPDRGLVGSFATLQDAVEAGRQAGFEFSVWSEGRLAASWSVFGGLRLEVAEDPIGRLVRKNQAMWRMLDDSRSPAQRRADLDEAFGS